MHEDKHLDLACWRINYSLHLTPHELYDYWQAHGTPTGAVLALKAAVEEIERLRSAVDAERDRCAGIVRNAAAHHGLCCSDCDALADVVAGHAV